MLLNNQVIIAIYLSAIALLKQLIFLRTIYYEPYTLMHLELLQL